MRNAILFILFAFFYLQLSAQDADAINWLTWEEATAKMEEEPKNMFIDMYTDWCGWCKKMDSSTFKDPEVVKYLNDNYYAVKFNAEQKQPITYQGFEFKFVKNGRRGYHQLAHSMLNGRMGYPAFVYFNQDMERIMISPGFKKVDQILGELEFAKEDKYKTMDLKEYLKTRA
jgi:thioredoxin-related protein